MRIRMQCAGLVLVCLLFFVYVSIRIADGATEQCVMNDFTFYPVPDVERPPKGESYTDPIFHTDITRITDCRLDCSGRMCSGGYPKHNIENADGTMLLVQGSCGNGWNFFNANPPYEYIWTLPSTPFGWSSPLDARWDNSDPDIVYCTLNRNGHSFYKVNVRTHEIFELYDFQQDIDTHWPGLDIRRVSMYEEGDASDDRRYWTYIIKAYDSNHSPTWWNVGLIVFDKDYYGTDNGKVISILKEGDPEFHGSGFTSMTPSGEYVWTGDSHRIYPRDLSSSWKIDLTTGHADMAISAEGREVIAGFKSGWAAMADVETGEITMLVDLASGGKHASGNSHAMPGWAVYCTYHPIYPEPESEWGHHEVFMVELTTRTNPPPRVLRLAHTHGIYESYSDGPFAKINMKGDKVFFGSAWGVHYADEGASYDIYQIDMPEECLSYFPEPPESCSDQSGYYCTDRDTQVCPGSWLYASDTSACCSEPCQDDEEAPSLSITHTPQNPSETQQVTLTATASDNVRLSEVRVYLDGQLVRTCSYSPCTNVSGPHPFGTHTYYATAEDYAGNLARDPPTEAKSFTVTEDTNPPNILKYHWLEAEYPDSITSPMQADSDSDASEDQYIHVPQGTGDVTDPSLVTGIATYQVTITEPGDYVLWGRTISPTGEDDSFFIEVDSLGDNTWDVEQTSSWNWGMVSDRGSGTASNPETDPVIFSLSAGNHTIKVKQREDGTKLDKLLLTNDLSYTPSGEGEPAENLPGELEITNLIVSSGKTYEVVYDGLQVGALVCIDRSYTFSSIPEYLKDKTYIKTANDDKYSSGDSFLVFDMNQDVTVYVAYDNRLTKPSWLLSFSDTGDDLDTTDANDIGFSIFEKDFSAGTVTLGGNEGGAESNMYSVIVVSKGSPAYHRADNNPQDGCVDTNELLAFLYRWKISSQDVPMPELMEAISRWKYGTGC